MGRQVSGGAGATDGGERNRKKNFGETVTCVPPTALTHAHTHTRKRGGGGGGSETRSSQGKQNVRLTGADFASFLKR